MRAVSDRNLLDVFVEDFSKILERHCRYIIVSGYVAISHGRSRGTEDVDVIIERITLRKFMQLHKDLLKSGLECIQPGTPTELYNHYLLEKTSIRYVKKGTLVPDMELKLARDKLDEYQLRHRVKLPLTETDVYFSTPETNIAFKEEYLKTDKDLEDAKHLRIIYESKLDEKEIDKIKKMIKGRR
ncbi:MAG: hypothetical protein V1744_02550 [Candidatus Altiarchaeota archaeon]